MQNRESQRSLERGGTGQDVTRKPSEWAEGQMDADSGSAEIGGSRPGVHSRVKDAIARSNAVRDGEERDTD